MKSARPQCAVCEPFAIVQRRLRSVSPFARSLRLRSDHISVCDRRLRLRSEQFPFAIGEYVACSLRPSLTPRAMAWPAPATAAMVQLAVAVAGSGHSMLAADGCAGRVLWGRCGPRSEFATTPVQLAQAWNSFFYYHRVVKKPPRSHQCTTETASPNYV